MIKIEDYSQFKKYVVKKKDKEKLYNITQQIKKKDLEEKPSLEIKKADLIEIEEKPIILLVSDIHLGAYGSIAKAFESFIDQIIKNEFNEIGSNLKAFIILGDFFDVMMAGCDDLISNHTMIYEKLYDLQQTGVNVFFILGNHEIRVDGLYDIEFSKRKSDLVEKFREYSKNNKKLQNLFLLDNFCQYIIFRKRFSQQTNQLNWELALFNSKEKIKRDVDESEPIISKILCEVSSDENKEYKCLMAHGFQFESPERLKIASEVWKGCIETLDIVKKIVFNFFWNIIVHTFRDVIYTGFLTFEFIFEKLKQLGKKRKLKKEFKKNLNYKQKLKKRWITDYLDRLKEMRKIRFEIDNEKYNKEIEEFLSSDEFSNIKDVIYGHTHRPQAIPSKITGKMIETPMLEQEVMIDQAQIYERQEEFGQKIRKALVSDEEIPKGLIVNTGTWQIAMEMDRNPNIVGIYPSGQIKVYEGIVNKDKNKIIKLKLFS